MTYTPYLNSLLKYPARVILAFALFLAFSPFHSAKASTFAIGASDFLLDNKPFQIKAGEMHPARIPRQYWADRLRMAHAMGLNTISIYVFWNQHEPRQGEFNFSRDADIAEFVRLAQKEGLWVILRPGPYVCAEWEFGGLPWWLLQQKDLKVRTSDPRFLSAAASYLDKLGAQLAPLQITHGGPIIMAQVENEYGSFGGDHLYMAKIRDLERAAGFDVPLFTADGGGQMMSKGSLPDVLPGLNGGSGPDIMKEIGRYRPQGPWFVPEFYPGWLDHWGEAHANVGIPGLVRETEWKLSHNISFCYYMIYGGTSFAFTSGANFGGHFQPQPTSYDYDAPIDEAGRPTKKFYALRDVFARHLPPGENLPPIPAVPPLISIPPFPLTEAASLFDNLPTPITSEKPLSFEDLNQGCGYVLYRAKIHGPIDATLKIKGLCDFAVVCLDGQRIATLDRRHKQDATRLQSTSPSATLDILVENGGRINYGNQMWQNRKGITDAVTLGDRELLGWQMFKLPFENTAQLHFAANASVHAPCLRRGYFNLTNVASAFLDLRGWGKGIVFVNGHNLGRYWQIGPQQTLYLPGVWLQQGSNEVIVFEETTDGASTLAGLDEPILNHLAEDNDAPAHRFLKPPQLDAVGLVQEGSLLPGEQAQEITFPARNARSLCLQALSSQNSDDFTTIAEINVLDSQGRPLPRASWKIAYVDSEETEGEDGSAENAIDGDPATFWHTRWSGAPAPHPHAIVVDLGAAHDITAVRILPRQDTDHGRIKNYRLYLSSGLFGITP